jgi:hypothetical protein
MTAPVPTSEPAVLRAGDTWTWQRSLPDYPASAGWSLRYVLVNAEHRKEFDSAASGNDHLVTVAADASDDTIPGDYTLVCLAINGAQRFTVSQSRVQVRPNVAATRPFDARSQARRALEAIEAVLERRASLDQEEYAINGRSLKRTPIKELLELRDRYLAEVRSEEAAQAVSAGLPNPRRVGVRFQRV